MEFGNLDSCLYYKEEHTEVYAVYGVCPELTYKAYGHFMMLWVSKATNYMMVSALALRVPYIYTLGGFLKLCSLNTHASVSEETTSW